MKPPKLAGFVGCWSKTGSVVEALRTDVPISDFVELEGHRVVSGIDLFDEEWRGVLCQVTRQGSCAWMTEFNYVRSIKAPYRLARCGIKSACIMGTFIGSLGIGGLSSYKTGDVFLGAFAVDE